MLFSVSKSPHFYKNKAYELMYGYAHDRTGAGNNAQEVGLINEYFRSQATELYAAAGFIQNRNKADFSLNGTAYSGLTVAPGADMLGVIVGFVHKF